MAKAAAISFKEFRTRYHTEDACREELFRQRFPDGFVCPKCGCKEFYIIRSRNTCQCRSCRHQTSVTAGTMMHRTHLPLTVWFWAIYLCVTDKRGISAVQLSRTLGISYDSAWHLLERIRKAMGQRDRHYQLSDIVEMDDYYIGSPSHNGKRGRGTDKIKAVAAISKTEDGIPLFVRMKVVDDFKGKTLQQIVGQCFAEQAKVECDGYHSYRAITSTKLVICIGFIQQSAISRHFYWEPTTVDVFICKAIWMSFASALTAETQVISCFYALPGLLLHPVPCCVKSISILYFIKGRTLPIGVARPFPARFRRTSRPHARQQDGKPLPPLCFMGWERPNRLACLRYGNRLAGSPHSRL